MNIAIFGDLHGRILLAFWLVKCWQEAHGETIDHILCVGDVGVYPSFETMDKASRRFAEKYPEELGFSKFFLHREQADISMKFSPHPAANDVFSDVTAPMHFVAGNHEDHSFIRKANSKYAHDARAPFAVDVDWVGRAEGLYAAADFSGWSRLRWLPEGPVFTFDGAWEDEVPTKVNVRAINGLDKYTMPQAWEAPKSGSVDILLSHNVQLGRLIGCRPDGRFDNAGSESLATFINKLAPAWHFFGHMHWPYPEQVVQSDWGAETRSIGMNQLFFESKNSLITPGAFGVMSIPQGKSADTSTFAYVEDEFYSQLRYGEVERFLV